MSKERGLTLMQELERTFNFLAVIPVSGDGVEHMAAAREHLRRAYQLAKEREEAVNSDG